MELIKQVEINIDYILELIRQYHEGHSKDTEIIVKINKAVGSSIELRSKKDLIDQFISSLTPSNHIDESWQSFIEQKKREELERLITEENLNKEETFRYIENAFRDGYVQETGTAITRVMPPVSRFNPSGDRTMKREIVLTKIKEFFQRFFDISG
jgi:type I restriction enzyme R subunit